MKYAIPLLFVTFVTIPNAFAIKWKECIDKNAKYLDIDKKAQKSKDFLPMLTTESSTTSSSSSTSFTVSSGPCRFTASREVRNKFIAQNFYNVKLDSARGHGDYVTAVSTLSGCSTTAAQNRLARKLQNHFQLIYLSESAGTAGLTNADPIESKSVGAKIDDLISTDSALKTLCEKAG